MDIALKANNTVTNVAHIATQTGSVEILKLWQITKSKMLFEKKCTFDSAQKWVTVLGSGVNSGHVEVVKFLIETMECGDVDEAVDGYGNKAIMRAACSNNVELMKYLIDKSSTNDDEIDDQMNEWGQTPSLYTGTGNAVEAMKYLLNNYKIDVNIKGKNGHTTLMFAAINGSIDAIKYLVSNYKNEIDGNTALSLAIEKKRDECVEFLKMNGAK